MSVIEDLETEKVTVNFADGKSEDNFDIVIGADGISSTVKQFTEYGDRTVLSLLPDTDINAAAQSNNVNGNFEYDSLKKTQYLAFDDEYVIELGTQHAT